jgi:hypothetical protein
MERSRWNIATVIIVLLAQTTSAEPIPVRHLEGVTFGFLTLRTQDGAPIAYGDLTQVVKGGRVTDELKFHFKDGSFYQEITVFTQREEFRLLSDQVIQKGPSFKDQLESWLDVTSGKLTVRHLDKDESKVEEKHLDLPNDVSNGLVLTLLKNVDPNASITSLSMVSIPSGRVVRINVIPEQERSVRMGFLTYKAQHYRLHFEIGGIAGKVAPLVGKQPPDMHVSFVKSQAPVFIESEGPLYGGGPIWRIQQSAPTSVEQNPQIQ